MIALGGLTEEDRADWENLVAGYNKFYGRTLAPELTDCAWREFAAGNRMHGARMHGARLVGVAHFLTHASTTSADVRYPQDRYQIPLEAQLHRRCRPPPQPWWCPVS